MVVCVCVLGGSERRGCAYFRFRVHCEYISGIMSFGFNTLRCYPRVRHIVATVYVSSALCRLLGNCVSVKARRW